ncbi:MAG: AraC family transcriptional regulator [Bacteroidota bacterium]
MRAFHEDRSGLAKTPITVGKSGNLTFLAHWHTEVELVRVLEGALRVGINDEVRTLREGEMAIVASRAVHSYETDARGSLAAIIIFRPEVVGCPGGWPSDSRFLTPFIDGRRLESMEASVCQRMQEDLLAIMREKEEGGEAADLFIRSRILDFCGLALRHLPRCQLNTVEERRKLLALERMRVVLDYLERNYMNPITIKDAADQIHLSVFHFARMFKKTMGLSFKDYLDGLRIDKTEALIRDTGLPMTEIALECGFQSVRTFNRVFKATKGCVPSSLR